MDKKLTNTELIDILASGTTLSKQQFIKLLESADESDKKYLFSISKKRTEEIFGDKIFIRGLIEFSNYCKNDCYYCGIRKSNSNAARYRLTPKEIFNCCDEGYSLGFRTFVLQSGEDEYFTTEKIVSIIKQIKSDHPDCAVTLSIGEKTFEEYEAYRKAGADRYLLRHETADKNHFSKLKPPALSFDNRISCLNNLKKLGFQTGCGFMVGSPYQTTECIAEDLLFISKLKPEMIGIGPFIPHHDTPFKNFPKGSVDMTILLIAMLRLLIPNALIPATTALGTADEHGQEKGFLAGANVIMPNLSPADVRKKYSLYDNKLSSGSESAECLKLLEKKLSLIGRKIVIDRGDFISQERHQVPSSK